MVRREIFYERTGFQGKRCLHRGITFYYECCKLVRKKGVGWEATLNQGESPSISGTCHVCYYLNRFCMRK